MSEEELEIDIDATADEDDAAAEKKRVKAKKGASANPVARKIRLTLVEDEGGPLGELQDQLKDRGLKNYDLSTVVGEALSTIDQGWWKEKLDELTPLEGKIQAALDNPEMREKLVSLLDG